MPLYLLQQCVEKRKSSRLVGGQGEHGKRHSLSLLCFMKKEKRGWEVDFTQSNSNTN